jgi:hypothetical protein
MYSTCRCGVFMSVMQHAWCLVTCPAWVAPSQPKFLPPPPFFLCLSCTWPPSTPCVHSALCFPRPLLLAPVLRSIWRHHVWVPGEEGGGGSGEGACVGCTRVCSTTSTLTHLRGRCTNPHPPTALAGPAYIVLYSILALLGAGASFLVRVTCVLPRWAFGPPLARFPVPLFWRVKKLAHGLPPPGRYCFVGVALRVVYAMQSKRRYFALDGGRMHYYESEDSAARWPDLTSLGQVCALYMRPRLVSSHVTLRPSCPTCCFLLE